MCLTTTWNSRSDLNKAPHLHQWYVGIANLACPDKRKFASLQYSLNSCLYLHLIIQLFIIQHYKIDDSSTKNKKPSLQNTLSNSKAKWKIPLCFTKFCSTSSTAKHIYSMSGEYTLKWNNLHWRSQELLGTKGLYCGISMVVIELGLLGPSTVHK